MNSSKIDPKNCKNGNNLKMVDFRAKSLLMTPLKSLVIEKKFALKSTISELLPFLKFFGPIFELFMLIEFTTEFILNGHFVMRTNNNVMGPPWGLDARIYFLSNTLPLSLNFSMEPFRYKVTSL